MFKVSLTLMLVVVGALAQPVPTPILEIPESFTSRFEVTIKSPAVPESKGDGSWDRSATLEDFKRIEYFRNSTGTFQYEHIAITTIENEKKERIFYRVENEKCTKEVEHTPFPKIWSPFVDPKTGKYDGKRRVPFGNSTVEVEVWTANYGEGEMEELWAKPPPQGSNVVRMPFAMERRRGSSLETRVFSSFIATNPPATYFSIPTECPIRSRKHHRLLGSKLDRL